VLRTVDSLTYFVQKGSDVGVSELSQHLGCSKGAAHRILASLEEAGYVGRDPETSRYHLAFRSVQLGVAAQRHSDVRRIALPHMENLRNVTGETITLSVLAGDERAYMEVLESPQEIRQTVELGRSYPLYLGASGKSLLAFLLDKRREQVLATALGKTYSDGRKVDATTLEQELVTIRSQGFAISVSERIPGAVAIAAPIFDHTNEVVGGISVAGPATRLTPEGIESFAPALIQVTTSISRDLGMSVDE
jgi:DNA-binding IclR family transcriptional regulator